jgi:hypothetical protein
MPIYVKTYNNLVPTNLDVMLIRRYNSIRENVTLFWFPPPMMLVYVKSYTILVPTTYDVSLREIVHYSGSHHL